MSRSRRLVPALCALAALPFAPGRAGAAAAPPAPWRAETPLAAHAMLYLNSPYGFKQSLFAQSADLGASAIRMDLALTAVFGPDGSESWQDVDEVMALARASRIRPVGIVLATPWGVRSCPSDANSYKCPPADLDAWKDVVAKLAAHTRGVIDTFEILNEPDGRWAFTGTVGDYPAMLRAAHDAIVAANPSARIAIGATMALASRAWLGQVLALAGPHAERFYDIANVHIRASLEALPRTMAAWRSFFRAHDAGDKPLWVTEFGYSSDPAYQYDRAYRYGPAAQAAYLRRALPALLAGGAARVFVTLATIWPGSSPTRASWAARSATRPWPTRPSCASRPSPRCSGWPRGARCDADHNANESKDAERPARRWEGPAHVQQPAQHRSTGRGGPHDLRDRAGDGGGRAGHRQRRRHRGIRAGSPRARPGRAAVPDPGPGAAARRHAVVG
jgi:hypothetical protein